MALRARCSGVILVIACLLIGQSAASCLGDERYLCEERLQ